MEIAAGRHQIHDLNHDELAFPQADMIADTGLLISVHDGPRMILAGDDVTDLVNRRHVTSLIDRPGASGGA